MSRKQNVEDTIVVVTATGARRGGGAKALKVEMLAENMNVFLSQVGSMMDKTPEVINKFQLSEFSVSAEISAKGQIMLLGTGGGGEAKGGITFTFKRLPVNKEG